MPTDEKTGAEYVVLEPHYADLYAGTKQRGALYTASLIEHTRLWEDAANAANLAVYLSLMFESAKSDPALMADFGDTLSDIARRCAARRDALDPDNLDKRGQLARRDLLRNMAGEALQRYIETEEDDA